MLRSVVTSAVLGAAICVSGPSFAQAPCTRADLESAVDAYLSAQAAGDAARLPLAQDAAGIENSKAIPIAAGIVHVPLEIDFHRNLLDVDTCETFTEIVVTDKGHPYVLGVHLKVAAREIAAIESVVTDQDDWLFNAAKYLEWTASEDWGPIAPAARDTRETLLAAANAYFDIFANNAVQVPWGTPCNRLEGGLRTGRGEPDDSCNVGVPSDMKIVDRHFVVDRDIGAVVGLNRFGKDLLPDSHLFRVENGKIRFVHTLTVCTIPHCGFPVPDRAPR
jgi:hypothetical protein